VFDGNNRPTQPWNGRKVVTNKFKDMAAR